MSEDDNTPTSSNISRTTSTTTSTNNATSVVITPMSAATSTQPRKFEKNGFLNASTGSSPPAPQALLSSSAALSPGLPFNTTTTATHNYPSIPPRSPSPSPTRETPPSGDPQITPRARQPSSSSSSSRLIPPDHHHHPNLPRSRPTSQTSLNSSSSQLSSLNSPLCTPKVRDYAYPRTHKYHAPSFAGRRYSISSRSSTASDIDSLFPQRIGGGPLYIADESWKLLTAEEGGLEQPGDAGDEDYEVMDGEEEESVERRAVCVFDFQAECEGEISIEIGQVVWVEFRKGVSGWLVVRDEITESKGLVPEGYVRFLNEDEERQYLAQSPPSNTLLPRSGQDTTQKFASTGEDTPRQITSTLPTKESWDNPDQDVDSGGDWVDDPIPQDERGSRDDWMDGMIAGVQKVNVQRPPA